MFERFTQNAREVVIKAQAYARDLNYHHIGTEHMLLGLIECGGIAGKALAEVGVFEGLAKGRVIAKVPPKPEPMGVGHIPFTPQAKKMMELSLREALGLGHSYIDTEHLLLGIIRLGDSPGAEVLQSFHDLMELRQVVINKITEAQVERRSPQISQGEPLGGVTHSPLKGFHHHARDRNEVPTVPTHLEVADALRKIRAGADSPRQIANLGLINWLELQAGSEMPLDWKDTHEVVVTDLRKGDLILDRGHVVEVMEDVTDAPFVSVTVSGPGARLVTSPCTPLPDSRRYARVDVVPNGTRYVVARPGDWGYPD